jgi:predicted nucleotidyltransferase
VPILGIIIPDMGISKIAKQAVLRSDAPSAPPDKIAGALFSRTQQRVLGLIFGQPDRSFFANELIALTRSGSGAVQRELQKLVESGLVTSRDIGRQRHFQANPQSPIFNELRQIMLKTVGVGEPIRLALQRMKTPIHLALIYGSIAKGDATAQSDIDLLVVDNHIELEALYRTLEPVEKQLARKISPNLMTSAEFERRRRESKPFVARVLGGPTISLIGDIDAR